MVKISVIIPVYNGEKYLAHAIESCLAQTCQDIEILVIDDGSADHSVEIAQGYAHRDPQKIIALEHPDHQNHGVSATRNLGVQHASGEYLAFLDADNYWAREKLQTQLDILEAYPEVGLVYCSLAMVDEQGHPTTRLYGAHVFGAGIPDMPADAFDLFFSRSTAMGLGSSTLIRKRILHEVGLFDVDLDYGEDEVVAYKITYLYPVFFQPQALVKFRIHDTNCIWALHASDPHNHIGYRLMLRTYRWLNQHTQKMSAPDARIRIAQLAVQAYQNRAISRWSLWKFLGNIFPYRSANWKILKIFVSLFLGPSMTVSIRRMLRTLYKQNHEASDNLKL